MRKTYKVDPQLAKDLEAEFRLLTQRRTFGLVFEPHQPEAVNLPGRPIRRGDKVCVLPPRGTVKNSDQRIWRVERIQSETKVASLIEEGTNEPQVAEVSTDDLMVVAEFRDTIYPGLIETNRVERGGDKPFHTVINAENFHALELLTYTHRHGVDVIYIDPPYNTGAKDWKYNNDYVEKDDDYRHSKWLAFLERRLKIARDLLNPENSVLIVTIDEKEYLRLGLLLEQTFPEARIQMVTSVISAKGVVRAGQFSRVEEFIFFVTQGNAQVQGNASNMLPSYTDDQIASEPTAESAQVDLEGIEWLGLRRREPTSKRGARPNQFYPIFVSTEDGVIESIGDAVSDDVDISTITAPPGTVALWPTRPDGTEALWGLTPDVLRRNWQNGYVKVNWNERKGRGTVYYLPTGTIKRIASGEITITSRTVDGAVVGHVTTSDSSVTPPKRVWNMKSHNAETGGTNLLSKLIPKRRFPFPKSLYAVEDALRFFIKDKPEAIILDFFSGSGTTTHAVMRLNRQDGGRRQCISVTNNEVSADEQKALCKANLRPGDPDWEKLGICDYITKPRIQAAITGQTPEGELITGDYKFIDEFPMSEGFEENAAFFTLTYEAPLSVSHHRAFQRIAPLLWMRAGSQGKVIENLGEQGWEIVERYGVLRNLDAAAAFFAALAQAQGVGLVYVITDDDAAFQMVCRDLPGGVTSVRLYESYLQNFQINSGRME